MATKNAIRPWYFGNTTVRSPFRLRDGLLLINNHFVQGNLHGAEQEKELCKLLSKVGIVALRGDVTYSVGRKWRSALSQHGFIYPQVTKKSGINQLDIGQVDTITPNGINLLQAESVAGIQECFLRSMASYCIPNVLDTRPYSFEKAFYPLHHILKIILELEKRTKSSMLKFLEIALLVIWTNPDAYRIEEIVESILKFRDAKCKAESKRKFDQDKIKKAAEEYGYKETTFSDYADLTIRYLKATGLVQAIGNGITLVPEKHSFVEKYTQDTLDFPGNKAYLIALCNGAKLPTDSKETAELVLTELVNELKSRNEQFDLSHRDISDVAKINLVRCEVEDRISILKEADYANKQAQQWKEISAYMDLLITNSRSKKRLRSDNEDEFEIVIPSNEAPAYFEWVIWRAFLAINKLANLPNECRKFKIDQDFLPVSTAPGNGPDLIFEFKDFVVVVEVTLTTSSRQEAAEGESVRRHVAACVSKYKHKPVYGLFLANKIDSNTAETFRSGIWYNTNDQKIDLGIVPLPLLQFKGLFEAMFKNKSVENSHIQKVLDLCRNIRTCESPIWKKEIADVVTKYSAKVCKANKLEIQS